MFIRDLKQEKSTKSFIDLDAFEEHSTNEHNQRKIPSTKVEMHAKDSLLMQTQTYCRHISQA